MLTRLGRLPLCCFLLLVCAPLGAVLGAPASAGAPQIQTKTQRNTPQQPTTTLPPLGGEPDTAADPFRAGMEARRLKMQNDDRHKKLVADTEKLLSLSTELKEEVGKTTKNELSMDVIRKAAEIEKLAHDVKERMRS